MQAGQVGACYETPCRGLGAPAFTFKDSKEHTTAGLLLTSRLEGWGIGIVFTYRRHAWHGGSRVMQLLHGQEG
jgi:hypothetical protein